MSLTLNFDCLVECDNKHDKAVLTQILMFFMERRSDTWHQDNDCVGKDFEVSTIIVTGKPMQQVAFINASPAVSGQSQRRVVVAGGFNTSKVLLE
jgi:hypothetical protein